MTTDELRSIADSLATVGDGCMDSPDVHALVTWTEQTLRLLADADSPSDAWRDAERNADGAQGAMLRTQTIIGTADVPEARADIAHALRELADGEEDYLGRLLTAAAAELAH